MKIKICGLKRPEDIRYVNILKPDYIGFVFAQGKRQVDEEAARTLKQGLDTEIKAVGIFVDENPEKILNLLEEGIIDIVQLHGQEEERTLEFIREKSGKPVWKAIKVESFEDVRRWQASKADMLVLDNGKGTGVTFDWTYISQEEQISKPYFLAGGLRAENIEEAIHLLNPYGIDISSGVETDGTKDFEKMKRVMDLVRKTR